MSIENEIGNCVFSQKYRVCYPRKICVDNNNFEKNANITMKMQRYVPNLWEML